MFEQNGQLARQIYTPHPDAGLYGAYQPNEPDKAPDRWRAYGLFPRHVTANAAAHDVPPKRPNADRARLRPGEHIYGQENADRRGPPGRNPGRLSYKTIAWKNSTFESSTKTRVRGNIFTSRKSHAY